ncbi:MAG: beta strand repeat-containing protein, partial [Blastocatellia bacterium]
NSVVRFNGQDRQTNFISSTELRATILASDILNGGSATITVFNPTPAGGVSNPLTLTINFAPPSITTLSPTSAVAGGPAFQLTVFGTNFAPGSVVRWNGQDRVTQFIGVTELAIQVPAADIANVGSATISVFSPPPGGGLSNEVTFNINQAARPVPRITTINPNNAAAGGADFTLTVSGQNFVSDSVVRWNGSARPTMFVNSTQLTAQIPAADIASVGTASVTVFTPPAGGGESNAAIFTINAPSNPVPVITSLSPATVGAGGPAFTLTVNGTGFVPGSIVQINGENRQTTVVSATQLTVQITAEDIAVSGSVAIRVFNPAPGGGTSNQAELTVINPVPTITSLHPNVVAEGSGVFVLAVNGTNFVFGAQILINNVPRITTFINSTQLIVTIQASEVVVPTTLNVQVVNPPPGGGSSNTVALEVRRRNPIPRTASISPETVAAGGPGFVLIVNGTGFTQGSVVRVNDQDRQTDLVSDTSLAAQIPASDIATGGTLAITVFNPSPGGGMSNPTMLMVNNPAPRITSISPDAAAAGSQAFTLIVNGSGFVTTSVVRFAGNDLPTSFVTSSQLSVVVPASSVAGGGTVPVTVFNPAPGGGTSNTATFSITNPIPVIANITPDQVMAAGPSFTLTVNGSGFVSGLVVRVNGQDRQTNFVNGTQLTATIPASDITAGGTLNITVASPAPGGATSNTVPLAVINPAPAISGLSPNAVVVGSAAFPLTVNGSGFVPGAVVNWNGSARVTAFVNSSQLTAQITAADVASIGTANITVFNPTPGGGVSNAATLTISNQPNPTPALTTLTPNSIAAGSAAFMLTVNGTSFVPGAVVNWNGSPRTTAFVSNTQLTAQITAEDVAAQGVASVTAVNPAPGGGVSNALTFTATPPNPVPTLTSLTPNTAAFGSPAFTLTVNGTSFVPGAVVTWNGSPRQTTFFSASQLFAQIPAEDIATVGTASVTVVNPTPGGGASNALTFTISAQPNPVPAITALNPNSALAGDDPFTLVVTGTNFVAGSVVQWNGSARPTTVVSGTELRAQISAADVAAAGAATITVVNPAPGGGVSNSLSFTITPLQCQTICMQSPQYYFSTNLFPAGFVLIGGVNDNIPISTLDNVTAVIQALEGGANPLQILNRQFVTMQLNAIPNGPYGGPLPPSILNSTLRCYGVNFTPTQLSNGFTLSRDMTFGQLLAQAQSAIFENRTNDMPKLATVLALLNGNDPSNRCQ